MRWQILLFSFAVPYEWSRKSWDVGCKKQFFSPLSVFLCLRYCFWRNGIVFSWNRICFCSRGSTIEQIGFLIVGRLFFFPMVGAIYSVAELHHSNWIAYTGGVYFRSERKQAGEDRDIERKRRIRHRIDHGRHTAHEIISLKFFLPKRQCLVI